jgi:hypothetical protein
LGLRDRPRIVEAVERLAWALAADGQAGQAALLLACAARERDEMGIVLPPIDLPYHERALCAVQDALGQQTFAATWAEGEALDLEEATERASRGPPE